MPSSSMLFSSRVLERSGCPVVARRPARSAAAPPLPSSLPSPPAAADRHRRIVCVINSPGGRHRRRRCRSRHQRWRAPDLRQPTAIAAVAAAVAAADYVYVVRPHPLVGLSGPPPPACLASSAPPPLIELSASCTPRTTLSAPPPPLVVSSAARPPRGNIATTLSLRPPPPPSRFLRAVHCRLPARACRQREDIAATIDKTTSYSPTNEGVHHREESHGVCHSRGASSDARNVVGIAPPRRRRRRAATAGDPREGGGEGGVGKPSSRKRSISPARDIIASQEAESVVPRRFAFTRRPVAPRPPRASPQPCRPCARGRLPAGNEAIDQDGQRVVGRRRTPQSSPPQFSQPPNPPILLFARLIFQSRSYKFSTPNFPLTKKKVIKTTLCTTGGGTNSPKIPRFFRRGIRAPL